MRFSMRVDSHIDSALHGGLTPGHEAAERAANAYQAQGRRVVVRFPPEQFGDFNDLLRAEVAA